MGESWDGAKWGWEWWREINFMGCGKRPKEGKAYSDESAGVVDGGFLSYLVQELGF